MLAELGGEIRAEGSLQRQQPGDSGDAGSALQTEWVTVAPRGRLTPEERSEMAKKAALAGGRS
jgi:hypothetical protein